MTSSVVRLRRSSKALPKAKPAPEKRSWSLFDGLLLVWSLTAFWILPKPLVNLRSMLSKLMRCTETENLNACSQHWPIERAQFFSRQCPTACRTANTSTGEWIGVQSFASSSICAQSCPTLCDPMDCSPPVGCPYDFPCKNTEVSCHFLLQGIFPTQELNLSLLCLLHWQADSLPLSHPGSPNILISSWFICSLTYLEWNIKI